MNDKTRINDSSALDAQALRQKRLEALYAYRGEFREHPGDKNEADSLDLSCMDPREDEKRHQQQADLEAFHIKNAAAAFPKYKEGIESISTVFQKQISLALERFPKLHIIRVTGHTDCKAVYDLYKSLKKETSAEALAELNWILPVPAARVKEELEKAEGVGEGHLLRKLEQLVALGSMEHLLTMPIKNSPSGETVEDYVNRGLVLACGLRDVTTTDEKGRHPLMVFDPGEKTFVPVKELYQKVFPDRPFSAETIESEYKASNTLLLSSGATQSLIVPQGATSQTVAEISLNDVQIGIQKLLNEIGQKQQGMS